MVYIRVTKNNVYDFIDIYSREPIRLQSNYSMV